MIPRRRRRDGFSLLETSIVLVIVGLISAMAAEGWNFIETSRRVSTGNKLDTVENALLAYRLANNSLPCPADASLPNTDANYGVAAANPGSCTGGTPAATFSDATHSVVEGAVPFKTLNLPEEFMYDGWERKFAYAVNQAVTVANAMQSQQLNEMCGISVTDAGEAAGNRTSGAVYALVSFGPDGHGGYIKTGTRLNAGVTNSDELTNCHCDVNANATTYAASYVEKDMSLDASDAVHPFNDTVRFKERWQMMSTDDMYLSGNPVCSLGFRVDGVTTTNGGDRTGVSVAVGDVNGDGIPDLVIFGGWGIGYYAGSAYVVFGTKSGFPNPLPLSSLNGTNGFRLDGSGRAQYTSGAVGDVNGDGIADIVLGEGSYGDTVYVVFGGPTRKGGSAWTSPLSLMSTGGTNVINGIDGFQLTDPGSDSLGNSVAVGDVNGDGKADIIIGDYQANSGDGTTYVVFGGTGPKGDPTHSWATSSTYYTSPGVYAVNLTGTGTGFINGTNGFRLDGVNAAGSLAGWSVASGDVNGDGIADIVIGAVYAGYMGGESGSTYVVFGGPTEKDGTAWPAAGNVVLNAGAGTIINGTDGFRLDGVIGGGWLGYSVATGDVNGDGIADIIIGAITGNGWTGGSTNVVFGGTGPKGDPTHNWATSTYAASPGVYQLNLTGTGTGFLNGTNGFRLDGVTGGDAVGSSVATGDVNGDGYADIIIGARNASYSASSAGSTYVVFGGPTEKDGTPWPAAGNVVLNTGAGNLINGTDGLRFDGVTAGDRTGASVAAGDINGDGIPDLIIGATGGNSSAGYTYVLFGSKQAGHFANPFPLSNIHQ